MLDHAERHLKMACESTGAAWAAHAHREDGRWLVDYAYRLPKSKFGLLGEALSTSSTAKPPFGSKRAGSTVRIKPAFRTRLGSATLRAFTASKSEAVVVAGPRGEGGDTVWNLVAGLLAQERAGAKPGASLPRVDMELAYDMPRALKGVLSEFVTAVNPAGAWIGIRRGEYLGIEAQYKCPSLQGASFEMAPSSLLGRMRATRTELTVGRGQPAWKEIPHEVGSRANSWTCLPLVVGRRLIGAVAVWGPAGPSSLGRRGLRGLADRLAEPVDVLVTLNELTGQLKRLAMLNDFALTLSSATDLDGLAKHVVGYLRRAFRAESVELYVTALDGNSVQEFRSAEGVSESRTVALKGHALRSLLQARSTDGQDEPRHAAADPHVMTLPLRFRGQPVGALAVHGTGRTSFLPYDEHLLGLISTYLAGLIEYGRLRAEAAGRAQNLEESVRQLRAAQEESGARLAAQQNAETRLVRAAKLAAVGEMAAGIAHELNNPLTTVAGFAELVLDDIPADAANRADLEMILHESLRARAVVLRLLDFARQGETSRARADINDLLNAVLAMTTHFIHTSGVQLATNLSQDLPRLLVDGNQIKQVFLNLVHNALQAMPGGGWLKIKSEQRQRDGRDWIVVDVADDGVGIDPKDLNRIFEPFFTTRGSRGGTGLGLSVTYGIVTDHGGTIEVESRPGEGATFSVWLPV